MPEVSKDLVKEVAMWFEQNLTHEAFVTMSNEDLAKWIIVDIVVPVAKHSGYKAKVELAQAIWEAQKGERPIADVRQLVEPYRFAKIREAETVEL